MAFIDDIMARAKADKKTIVLPESMDKRTFDTMCSSIKSGNFCGDTAIYGYVSDSLYETRQLLDALWSCCVWQAQKIGILQSINKKLEESNKKLRMENTELHEQVAMMDALIMMKEHGESE